MTKIKYRDFCAFEDAIISSLASYFCGFDVNYWDCITSILNNERNGYNIYIDLGKEDLCSIEGLIDILYNCDYKYEKEEKTNGYGHYYFSDYNTHIFVWYETWYVNENGEVVG